MKKNLLLFCVLSLSMQTISYAQLENLDVFESLSENISKKESNKPNIPNDEFPEEDPQDKKAKNIINYADVEYSYYGANNFNRSQENKVSDEPLKYFGYDYFLNAPETFAQVTNIPIPSEYIIGPGDNIKVILYGKDSNEFTLEVTRSGEIFFPEIGPIIVGGLSFSDMKKNIEEIVAAQIIGTKINLTLGTLRNINIFVLGEAFQPGMYTVSALSSLMNSIFISGGLKKGGSLRNIQLKRNGKIITTFDFYDILLNGDTTNDVRLMSGDVIFIPSAEKTIGIDGAIFRPGIYEMREEETLTDLIAYAGSLKPKAKTDSVEILRVNKINNGFNLSQVSLDDKTINHFLDNGDVIKIPSVANNMNSAVLIRGHFQKPGFYPWLEGQKIGDLITSENILTMTDINYVLLKREKQPSMEYEYIQIDMEDIFADNSSNENILLEQRDEIILLPNLLSSDQITTKLFQDQFSLDNRNAMVEDNEWQSMSYLRKSLMEQETTLKKNEGVIINPITGEQTVKEKTNRYYEYSIFDYCVIPEQAAIKLVESLGFTVEKVINLSYLEDIENELELASLLQAIEENRIDTLNSAKIEDNNLELTQICRRQLIDPILNIINKQATDDKKIITVFGNVEFPGEYPLTENMLLIDAIQAGGGTKNATYNSEIELTRSTRADKKYSVSNSFASISNIASMQDKLKAMDIVNIKKVSTDIKTVTIKGEVYFAGTYPISESQTLTDLIRRAGGFTELASIKAANFQRQSLKEAEIMRLNSARNELKRKIVISSQTGGLGQETLDNSAIDQLTALLATDDLNEEALGRLVIDLQSIMDNQTTDIILEDGDTLNIPSFRQTVSVIGEVFVPNAHMYKDNLTINEYISFSGGLTDYADDSNIYLIKSNGSIIPPSKIMSSGFFKSRSTMLESGDTIVVPLEIQPFNTVAAASELSQIIYQMAIAAAAVNSF